MGQDRVLYWQGKRPTSDELGKLCTRYLGAAGTVVWQTDRYYLELEGSVSRALDGQPGVSPTMQTWWNEEKWSPDPRIIEVWADEKCIYVMTRQADELTSAVADGLLAVIHRFWRPTIDPMGPVTPV